ncbi:MAG: hypothetical protein WCR70_03700 [Sphaerochaetaceae bacterium]|jgi:hypothetical protein
MDLALIGLGLALFLSSLLIPAYRTARNPLSSLACGFACAYLVQGGSVEPSLQYLVCLGSALAAFILSFIISRSKTGRIAVFYVLLFTEIGLVLVHYLGFSWIIIASCALASVLCLVLAKGFYPIALALEASLASCLLMAIGISNILDLPLILEAGIGCLFFLIFFLLHIIRLSPGKRR